MLFEAVFDNSPGFLLPVLAFAFPSKTLVNLERKEEWCHLKTPVGEGGGERNGPTVLP